MITVFVTASTDMVCVIVVSHGVGGHVHDTVCVIVVKQGVLDVSWVDVSLEYGLVAGPCVLLWLSFGEEIEVMLAVEVKLRYDDVVYELIGLLSVELV